MDRSRLQAEADTLGVHLDDAQADSLIRYVALLERWNTRFNLISRRDIGRIWPRHILDSLSIAPLLAGATAAVAPTAFDIGTGAGLPGLPLAIALPEFSWLLLDRNQRKVRFLVACADRESVKKEGTRSSAKQLALMEALWATEGGSLPVGELTKAAGTIHSDLEKGFIRAEVVPVPDLLAAGSLAEAKKKALLRLEGKEYIVKDGDTINVRFNV